MRSVLGRVVTLLLLLAPLASCKGTPDVCAGVAAESTCVAVEVQADTGETASLLEVTVRRGDGAPSTTRSTPPDGQATGFPFLFPLVLGAYAGPVQVSASATLSGGERWGGEASATVEAGARAQLTLTLSPRGGGPDGGADDGGPGPGPGDGGEAADMAPTAPGGRFAAAATYVQSRNALLHVGGQAVLGGAPVADSWEFTKDGRWAPSPAKEPPPARHSAALAFDGKRNVAALFGGFNKESLGDLWFYDSRGAWTAVTTISNLPPPRADGALAYDPVRATLVLYGGYVSEKPIILTDTWELPSAATSWTLRSTVTAPKMRTPRLVSDTGNGLYLVGAEEGVADLRVYRFAVMNGNWGLVTTLGTAPSARTNAVVAFDPINRAILIHGGIDGKNAVLDELWALRLSDNTWVQGKPGPTSRAGSAGDHHGDLSGLVLHGGRPSTLSRVALSDTWIFNTRTSAWKQLLP